MVEKRQNAKNATLETLKTLFVDLAKSGEIRDKRCADLAELILYEYEEEYANQPQPLSARGDAALALLLELDQIWLKSRHAFPQAKVVLWRAVIWGWLDSSDAALSLKLGKYLLSVTALTHQERDCKEFDKLLRGEISMDDVVISYEKLSRISSLLAFALWLGSEVRPATIRCLAHAYVRYAPVQQVLEIFVGT